MTKGQTYSPLKVSFDGNPCKIKDAKGKSTDVMVMKSDLVCPSGPLSIGTFHLKKGEHIIKFENAVSKKYFATEIGFDCLTLIKK